MKNLVKLLVYFIIGMLIFTAIVAVTEVLIVNNLGLNIKFLDSYKGNFLSSLQIYIILYFIILILNYICNVISVKKLNEKLDKIKKGGSNDEK